MHLSLCQVAAPQTLLGVPPDLLSSRATQLFIPRPLLLSAPGEGSVPEALQPSGLLAAARPLPGMQGGPPPRVLSTLHFMTDTKADMSTKKRGAPYT